MDLFLQTRYQPTLPLREGSRASPVLKPQETICKNADGVEDAGGAKMQIAHVATKSKDH